MRNHLQDQLLKAGLAKKHKVDAAVREQARQRDGKTPPPPKAEQIDARQLLAERAERDRALAAERNAQAHAKELQSQIRQIVDSHKIPHDGEIAYRFVDDGKIKDINVNETLRSQLAKGALVIVRYEQSYAVIPRAAAQLIYERGGSVVLDHGRASPAAKPDTDDEYYQRFKVPDDLIW